MKILKICQAVVILIWNDIIKLFLDTLKLLKHCLWDTNFLPASIGVCIGFIWIYVSIFLGHYLIQKFNWSTRLESLDITIGAGTQILVFCVVFYLHSKVKKAYSIVKQ
jgi:hypothetical protein